MSGVLNLSIDVPICLVCLILVLMSPLDKVCFDLNIDFSICLVCLILI